jgi:hypothetical protein
MRPAYAGSQRQHQQKILAPPRAKTRFAQTRGIGIIDERNGPADFFAQHLCDRQVFPARQIRRVEAYAFARANRAGHTHADGFGRTACGIRRTLEYSQYGIGHARDEDFGRVVGLGVKCARRQNAARIRNASRIKSRAAEIKTNEHNDEFGMMSDEFSSSFSVHHSSLAVQRS